MVSEAVTRSAIERKESRGGHFRADYPDKVPAFATFNIVVRRGADGAMEVAHAPLPPLPPELQQVIEENKCMTEPRTVGRDLQSPSGANAS